MALKLVKRAMDPIKPKTAGRPRLPAGLKRVRLVATVDQRTFETFDAMAKAQPGSNIGRVLDELAAVVAPEGRI